ncbi:O-antigen ligase family protein [Flagellimonas hymeniacidonis]|nr:O-antigen ligase family protein [Flagellimonas hymeniacidonis]
MSLVIFLLQAKIPVIILVMLLLVIVGIELRKVPKKLKWIYALGIGLVLIFGLKIANPRFARLIKEATNISAKSEGSLVERIQYSKSALQLIYEAPFFGYGIGDVRSAMKKKIKELSYPEKIKRESYDPHNEFLKTLVGTGLLGFLILMTAFAMPLYLSYKNKNLILAIFLGMLALVCFVEPFISRQLGIFTALFFLGILSEDS